MSATFSEHWHRVAGQRVSLRPAVQMRRQIHRGEKWFVVLDPLNNQFFRIGPGAHDFVCRLGRGATVQEVWEQCLERDPDGAPGQEEVIRLLAQLHQANLLLGELPPDSAKLLDRHQKRRRRETRSLLNVMFLRIPLLDPDRFLQRAMPALRWLIGPLGAVLWLAVVGAAVKVAVDHATELRGQSEAFLAPENLPLLYAGLIFIKALHEFGHAFSCRYFGGEVHRMGVALMYFSPMPFVDATSSWAFASKWQRIFVAAGGMIAELFVAALATFVWANTGAGTLHSLAYNMIFVASVTTVLFNANPLLRYDGYYILSDLLEMPNLQTRSMQMLTHLAERYLFGCRASKNPAQTRSEAAIFTIYGIASWIYRVLVFVGIALFMSTRFLLLGILIALACVFSFTVKPLWLLARYLATNPRLERTRRRAVLVTCGAAAALIALLALVPMPSRFRAPGILQAEEYSEVFTSTPGTVREVLAASGSRVEKGQPLLRFESRELELEMNAARAELVRAIAEEERALSRNAAALDPLRSRRAVVEKRVRRLEGQQRDLLVIAPHAGAWVAPRIEDSRGQWFPRGQRVGHLVQDAAFRFTAVISQDDAANLFTENRAGSQVRIAGQSAPVLAVRAIRVIPAQQEMLPSAALGWAAGGEIAIAQHDTSGARAAEPFFELRASINRDAGVMLLHGRSGNIRVEMHPEPLLAQWSRKLRQLLQKKYRI